MAAFLSFLLVLAGLAVASPPAAQALTPPPVCPTTPITVEISSVLTPESGIISYQYWPGGTPTIGSNGCTITLQQPNGNIATAIGGNNGWRIVSWAGYATAVISSYGPVNAGASGIPNCNSPAAAGSLVDGVGGKRPVCSSSVGTSASVATITISVTTNTVANACTTNQFVVTTTSRESGGAQIWNGGTQTKGGTQNGVDCFVEVQEPDGRIDSIPGRGWKITGFVGYGSATIVEYGPVNTGPNGTPNCQSPAAFGYYTNDAEGNKRPVCSSALGTATSSSSITIVLTPRPTLTVTTAGGGIGTVTSAPTGINCGSGGAACVAPFEKDTVVTLTATPGVGSNFGGFTGCTALPGNPNQCQVTMNGSKAVAATFGSTLTQLRVEVSGTGGGLITSNPAGISCTNGVCIASFPLGTTVSLTAAPEAGSDFAGWTGAGCDGAQLQCDVVMTSDRTVAAQFAPEGAGQFQIAVQRDGTGSGTVTSDPAGIDCGQTCTAGFTSGTSVNLTAVPAAGSVFSGWTVTGGAVCGTSPQCSVPATQNRTVTALFNLAPTRSLTVSRTGTGTGTVTSSPAGITCGSTCSAPFVQGSTVTLTAVPAVDSQFDGWSGGGCTGTGTCTVTMATAQVVQASFSLQGSVATVPGKPTGVVGSPRIRAAVVTWKAPANGGSPITRYRVTASPGGRSCTATTTLKCTVTGLTNGVAYKFTVRATNAVGTGSASTASKPIVAGAPTAPRSLAVTFPAAGAARVTWAAPALVNAGPVLRYQVRKSSNNGATWGAWVNVTAKALRLSSQRKGTTYLVQVRAVNRAGAGPAAQLRFLQRR